jgi:hypothetical protein
MVEGNDNGPTTRSYYFNEDNIVSGRKVKINSGKSAIFLTVPARRWKCAGALKDGYP